MDNEQIKEAVTGNGGLVLAFAVLGIVSVVAIRMMKSLKTAQNASQDTVPETEPVQSRERAIMPEELAEATGEGDKPTYIAVKDPYSTKVTVFDVSSARDFYGPGSPYNIFAGKNATFGLAKSSLDPENVIGDLSTLTESEKDTHMEWHAKYSSKYPIVGYLVVDDTTGQGEDESVETTQDKKDV